MERSSTSRRTPSERLANIHDSRPPVTQPLKLRSNNTTHSQPTIAPPYPFQGSRVSDSRERLSQDPPGYETSTSYYSEVESNGSRVARRQPSNSQLAPMSNSSRHPSNYSARPSVGTRPGTPSDSSDDNVPLAKAIPTALKAQKSIRTLARNAARNKTDLPKVSSPARPQASDGLTRKGTTINVASRPSAGTNAAPPDELVRRLQDLQATSSPSRSYAEQGVQRSNTRHVSRSARPSGDGTTPPTIDNATITRSRLPSTSMSGSRHASTTSPPVPPIGVPRPRPRHDSSGRQPAIDSSTRIPSTPQPRSRKPSVSNNPPPGSGIENSTIRPSTRQRAMTLDASKSRPSTSSGRPSVPVPSANGGSSTRPPSWIDFTEADLSVLKSQALPKLQRPSTGTRRDRSPNPPVPRHPVEFPRSSRQADTAVDWTSPVPISSAKAAYKEEALVAADITEEQRVFIESKQRFCLVKIGVGTRARDVLSIVANKGQLDVSGVSGSDNRYGGGWMVFEMANDFGMERPIREYELIADIFATWNKDMRLNTLMIKRSMLRSPLSLKSMPNSSPIHEGLVQWEGKKGKWSKRQLRLREHCLFIGKKENGKDEVLLCSLSNFDAYLVTRVHRAPKPYIFALRSTDNLSMFENPDDSVHIFSCEKAEGERWVEKIMLARSYVLYQERSFLFPSQQSHVSAPVPVSHASAPLARANTTRKVSSQSPNVNRSPMPSAPLVSFGTNPFVEGSLLAKAVASGS